MPFDAYVICTSPRSGSTLLCRLLAATGVAGNPDSWFHDTSLNGWLDDLEVAPAPGTPLNDRLAMAFHEAIRQGTDGKGLFGLRQQGRSFPFLCEMLAEYCPDEASDAARMHSVFGKTLFVHLTRSDKVGQAISYLRAEQSGLWHVAPDGSELERLAPHRQPTYDQDRLDVLHDMLMAMDRNWNDWFRRMGIEPLRITYDALSADPQGTLRSLLRALGLDDEAATGAVPAVRKLADAESRAWATLFRRARGLGDGG